MREDGQNSQGDPYGYFDGAFEFARKNKSNRSKDKVCGDEGYEDWQGSVYDVAAILHAVRNPPSGRGLTGSATARALSRDGIFIG